MTIQLLDEETINQIAAGEVIESSASVVKELVENALDAKSSLIAVDIVAGGRHLIRVRDNGSGIPFEEVPLAIVRYATSKIRTLSDLERLPTMGFRGEALSSIAAVSKMKILTKGTLLRAEGGVIIDHRRVPTVPEGTEIEVSSLFFNTPVRRKFQASLNKETAAVVKVLTDAALAHPHISFQLTCDDKLLFKTTSFTLKERIEELLEAFKELIPCEGGSKEGISLEGFLSSPTETRPNRTGQLLFINQRPVHCPEVSYAVLEGYHTLLEKGRYPLFVLHLKLPQDLIDVNVHPQKREVRLRRMDLIRHTLIQSVEKALHRETAPAPHPLPWEMPSWSPQTLIKESISPLKVQQPLLMPSVKLVGLFGPYILVEEEQGLLFIDQKALLRRMSAEKEERIYSQNLLIPLSLSLTPVEALLLQQEIPHLHEKGFHLYSFGPHTFCIDAIPSTLKEEEVFDFFFELLEKKSDLPSLLIERRDPLSPQEALYLVGQWRLLGSPPFCPKGKPLSWLLEHSKIFSLKSTPSLSMTPPTSST